ncbi:BatA domain-containing protein [Stieleria varia]|uniref:Aerotolerance regulator N-terminal domain-containing protein n=1 Tax=Stieleria varia TaxID=2528005 RepID=A0A5C6ASL3_9BACT|nr:BatA domain-containing protein [Stieleria varia]TWU02975.1 hypothetical protein Pla52n_40640 [Stieleria varia]
MFLYPALLAGFFFVAVPLLVHLINMLRHRKQRWAAMDFLLASYRKQKKWIRMRQLLLLLARLAVAALLIALLCGWTGGRQLLSVLGGQTTHHVVILDDSYSMGDSSSAGGGEAATAYGRALQSLQALTQQLAGDDGNHQLTVMRASRAALAVRGGNESGDVAADLSAQTITPDGRLISRVMSTTASPMRTDLIAAIDLAAQLMNATPADTSYLYIASDFRARDWATPERIAESMRGIEGKGTEIRMIDCAATPDGNLAITNVTPVQDVWVAGVPVVVRATIKNYGQSEVSNVAVGCRVIRYGEDVQTINVAESVSGKVESLPALMIETLAPGAEVTKSFQVFVNEVGTHAIEVTLPDDALAIDNSRMCTLPLSSDAKVLVIDSDPDAIGAYHISSVLNPGSQVRIGAIPDIQAPAFLRSATFDDLAQYRAIYLVDLPEVTDSAAAALQTYVERGGGIAWFLGGNVQAESYNRVLLGTDRQLLPRALEQTVELPDGDSSKSGDIVFGDTDTLIDPLRSIGDASLSLIGLSQSWTLVPAAEPTEDETTAMETASAEEDSPAEIEAGRVRTVLARRDTLPLVTQHTVGQGRVVTILTGLDGGWSNWTGDPTFVPFLLLTNASLWSGAAPATQRLVDAPLQKVLATNNYFPETKLAPPSTAPPRVPIEATASEKAGDDKVAVTYQPDDSLISEAIDVDDLLRPGVFEWGLIQSNGNGQVIPVASVIRVGEGDLRRADQAELVQSLLPMQIKFTSSADYTEQVSTAGSSTITLVMLALLALILAAEQALAYWASYHVSSSATPLKTGPWTLDHSRGGRHHE